MRKHTNDRLQGTLDLLVLKTLASQGRMHGYAITLRIEPRRRLSLSGPSPDDTVRLASI
jgi:hypothetical protein